MFSKLDLYYFSPTGGTKKAAEYFCEGISKDIKAVDLGARDQAVEQPDSELVVIAVPVFGGRIPGVTAEKLNELKGSGKKAVTLVVYGNRAYEDALLELNNIVLERGFQIAASAALVAQHSMAPEVGKGRPDARDKAEILDFAGKVLAKLERSVSVEDVPSKQEDGIELSVNVPGNYPYKDAKGMPVTPISLPACVTCGKCASVCPTGAIRLEDHTVITAPETCILCMACVAACPESARILPPPLQEKMEQMLGAFKSVRKENEYFL